MSKAQLRMYELGIAQSIAHNLVKYHLGLSSSYTVESFLEECRTALTELGVSDNQMNSILEEALTLLHNDLLAEESTLLQMAGGSECTAFALLCGPVIGMQQIQI